MIHPSTLMLAVLIWGGIHSPWLTAQPLPADTEPLIRDYLSLGKAEFSRYEATIMRYGQPREGTVTHIWVKEPWDATRGVKWDGPGSGDHEVIKLNQVISYATGMYRYEQMWSGFWHRETGGLVKFSLSHHEACGNTFKQARIRQDQADYVHFSYFEGHGDGKTTFTLPKDALFYDELPLRLRLMVAPGLAQPSTVSFYPTVIHAKSDPIKPSPATIRENLRTPNEVGFEVNHPGGTDRLVYEATSPFKLLRWEMADGSRLRLRQSLFIDYWNHHHPGDERFIK